MSDAAIERDQPIAERIAARWRLFRSALFWRKLRRFLHHKSGVSGLIIVILVTLAAVLAPVLAPNDPTELTPAVLAAPSWAHPFGTDDLGRDVLSRVLYGARISPLVGVAAMALAAITGTFLGLVAAYLGGFVDSAVMRVMDMLLAFPGIILAIVVVAVLGPGLRNGMIAVAVAMVPTFARVVRGDVLVERERDYVTAARGLGAPARRIIFRELLPSVWSPMIVLGTLGVAGAILAGAGLSFLGLGAQPPSPEWGAMLNSGRNFIATQWWIATFPGCAIAITVLGINLMGDGLRDVLDPRL